MKGIAKILLVIFAVLLVLVSATVIYFGVRHLRTAAQVEREWQAAKVTKFKEWGATQSLLILPLVEAEASEPELQTEHGVSYLIKTDTATILFDVGMNANENDPSPLQANMHRLGVTLDEVHTIVISHNHPDHVGGVKWWRANTLSLGNQQIDLTGKALFVPEAITYPGVTPTVANQPMTVAAGVAAVATIPFAEVWQVALFRSRNAEQALAINVAEKGVVIITGCGHQTLPKLIARTQALFDEPIVGIVGGLHFQNATAQQLEPYIRQLQALKVEVIALSPHDSGEAARQAFRQAFPDLYQDVIVGTPIYVDSTKQAGDRTEYSLSYSK
jgi:7,8-dihydropterin-6-yl-methyl-4-(beta-D-ribofuranosyl)aminobenzene 5'-phosphate synthase